MQSALEAIAALIGAEAIALLTRSTESGSVETILSCRECNIAPGIIPHDGASYVPLCEAQWLRLGGETAALVKLLQHPDYSAWAVITVPEECTKIGSPFLAQMPALVALLASHAAALVARTEARARSDAVAGALDQHDCGIFILGGDHEILHANRAAMAMLERRAGLQVSRGKLRPLGYKDAVRFETAIDCVVDAQRAGGNGRSKAMLLLLPLPEGARRLAVTIAPARQHPLNALAKNAAAVILVEPADDRVNRSVESICQAYELSPVENQLVCHLAAGLSVGDAAMRMRVKVDTARAYLKQVFAKTGTHRQASLLQLVTRHQRVIQGDHLFAAT
ncbi:helix-turn-helix transcriptional regulator [Sphingomonas jeddahensis]|uniref:helix-turn-helix transcriptional regulator n=1 Tax=Sphingomonas jeddahensis TaxID=1915074 RepID=UPI001181A14C|nr:hypothetical protein [Sphingomonas jeddahensis]